MQCNQFFRWRRQALALTAAGAGATPSSSSLSVKPFQRCRFHDGFRGCTLLMPGWIPALLERHGSQSGTTHSVQHPSPPSLSSVSLSVSGHCAHLASRPNSIKSCNKKETPTKSGLRPSLRRFQRVSHGFHTGTSRTHSTEALMHSKEKGAFSHHALQLSRCLSTIRNIGNGP